MIAFLRTGIFILFLLSFLPFTVLPDKISHDAGILYFDKKLFGSFRKLPVIFKDDFWESRLNRIVQGRGIIKSIDKTGRYRKHYRIILIDSKAADYGVVLKYYVFINNIEGLVENLNFEFKGQLMAYTPVNSKRDLYILDIILESGSILVE